MKGKILVFSRFFRQKAQKDSFLLNTKKNYRRHRAKNPIRAAIFLFGKLTRRTACSDLRQTRSTFRRSAVVQENAVFGQEDLYAVSGTEKRHIVRNH